MICSICGAIFDFGYLVDCDEFVLVLCSRCYESLLYYLGDKYGE